VGRLGQGEGDDVVAQAGAGLGVPAGRDDDILPPRSSPAIGPIISLFYHTARAVVSDGNRLIRAGIGL